MSNPVPINEIASEVRHPARFEKKKNTLRVFLVEPYYTGSHRSWADGIASHSRHDVHLVNHAGGFWKWRMHGAAVTLADAVTELAAAHGRPDVVLVAGMVNVAALVGLARSAIGPAPVAVYMHENQLTYPLPANGARDEGYAMANWVSMCAADAIVFNSRYHEHEFWTALPSFLRRFPDHRHTGHVESVRARSLVLPVGIDPELLAIERRDDGGPPIVVWNHRWEYDKDPATFFASLRELVGRGIAFRVAIAGERFQTVPEEFDAARRDLSDRLVHFGTLPRAKYVDLLRRSAIVVSTAHHDFFGLAIAEAAAAGAVPVVPNRLAYPELLSPRLASECVYAADGGPTELLGRLLDDESSRLQLSRATRDHMAAFSWSSVIPRYDELFEGLARN